MSRRPSIAESLFIHIVLLLATCFALYPLLWVLDLALSGSRTPEARLLPMPRDVTLTAFREVAFGVRGSGDPTNWLFGRQFLNTLVVAGATAFVAIAIATPAAYALARFAFVGKERGIRVLLMTQMFPTVATLVPLYLILNELSLLNTRFGLVLCYAVTAVPFAIFQLRSAFDAIPVELEEAAKVDGATAFQAFLRVVLPAARPAMFVTGLFAFMSAYNEFILAATLLNREDALTLPVVLQRYVGEYNAEWQHFAAGALMVSVPIMALFYLVQRHLVAGLTAGSVKG